MARAENLSVSPVEAVRVIDFTASLTIPTWPNSAVGLNANTEVVSAIILMMRAHTIADGRVCFRLTNMRCMTILLLNRRPPYKPPLFVDPLGGSRIAESLERGCAYTNAELRVGSSKK